MKKFFLFLMMLVPIMVHAVEVNGINYSLDGTTASVTYNSKCVGDVVIPSSFECQGKTYSVTSIDGFAFSGCSGLTSVTIPNTVTSIGSKAFYGCDNLKKAEFGSLESLCTISFKNSSFDYTSNPLYYAHRLYISGTEVKDLVIPNSVTSIEDATFMNCSGITSVTIPNSVTSIGVFAFYECTSLTSVDFGNSVTEIGLYAFAGCRGLTSVAIPNSVTNIETNAFARCYGLTSVTIPNSVTSIGIDAFYAVNNINYHGSASGSTWGAKCVNGFVEGYLVYKDESKREVLGCSATATGEMIIPNSVTSIGESAFWNCYRLTSVTIGNSVTSIGDYAFSGCTRLTSVTIPNSVTSIRRNAFEYCI